MLDRRPRRLRLPFVLLLCAALCSAAAEEPVAGPSNPSCDPECSKYGTCGEDGCRCPFGRLGEACENDFLAPCKPAPGGIPACDIAITKSCECMRRCRQVFCRNTTSGEEVCEGGHVEVTHWNTRGCYERRGVPPQEQYSRIPEPAELAPEGTVDCFSGHMPGADRVNCSEALYDRGGDGVNAPMSLCPSGCNNRGYCVRPRDGQGPGTCRCNRGFSGAECEKDENDCYLKCSGRGTCVDQFCHCQPPYFSIGCTRSKVYPANHSRPNPANFKIYMYELNTHLAYDPERHDSIYVAYTKFLEQFLGSPVRTEDPSEAHLFYVPSFNFGYSGNLGYGERHLELVLDHIRHAHPWWNKTGGRDHFVWAPADRGACGLQGLANQLIRVTHFGHHTTPGNNGTVGHLGHPDHGCFHPLRDVVAAPYWLWDWLYLQNTAAQSVDDLLAMKNRTFIFSGTVRQDADYSGNARQTLAALMDQWQEPGYLISTGIDLEWIYENFLRETKFCFAPHGHGFGNRIVMAMMAGCVPVIVQEHVFQPYEELLPYEDFSVRLTNADLPRLREILRGISDQQYRSLLEGVLRYHLAFTWNAEQGGRAFEYTVASLQRRYLNLKALYY